MAEITEPTHLCYRCFICGRLLTSLEIMDRWANPEGEALCRCGSSKVSPGNPIWWEELIFPRVWKLWWLKVVTPWAKAKGWL